LFKVFLFKDKNGSKVKLTYSNNFKRETLNLLKFIPIFEQILDKYTSIMKNTSQEYDNVIAICRSLFINKMTDYGSAWRILRLPSLTDQIFIKAQRIRGLQENSIRKVNEDETGEFIGIINYSLMALIQLELGVAHQPDLDVEKQLNYMMLKSN
jgi:hypothetical protein